MVFLGCRTRYYPRNCLGKGGAHQISYSALQYCKKEAAVYPTVGGAIPVQQTIRCDLSTYPGNPLDQIPDICLIPTAGHTARLNDQEAGVVVTSPPQDV